MRGLFFGIIQQPSIVPASFPMSGLTSYWSFQTTGATIYDDFANIEGSVANTVIFNSNGKIGRGILTPYNNNTNDYRIIANGGIGISDFPLTISFWMKHGPTWSSAQVGRTFQIGNFSSNYYGILSYYYNNTLSVQFGNGGGAAAANRYTYDFINLNTIMGDNQFHHFLITATSRTTLKLYVDGVEYTDITMSGSANSVDWGNAAFRLFGNQNSYHTANLYFDEFASWNRVLSEDEITDVYNFNGTI